MLLAYLGGCTTQSNDFQDKVLVEPIDVRDGVPSYVQTIGEQVVEGSRRIQWFSCAKDASSASLVMLSEAPQSFSKANACTHPAAVESLERGFNVLLINRPGHSKTQAEEMFGDETSLKQILQVLKTQAEEGRRLVGLWGYGDGSILALRLARQLPWKFLIVGNGIYDWDQTLKESSDQTLTESMKRAASNSDPKFAEQQSAAWDLSGLPKQIYLYHGGKNTRVLPSQAQQFKSTLAASEYQVELMLLNEDGSAVRADYHRSVISTILSRIEHKP